jgi:hypothetical protein
LLVSLWRMYSPPSYRQLCHTRSAKDSYTDKNTGVTHIYVRQLVNGLEVTDGDMNINIKDGVVWDLGAFESDI